MVQDPPDHTPIPHRLARARPFARVREAPPHLANTQPIAPHPGKHVAPHAGFVRDNLIAGLAAARMLVDIAIALGRPTEPIHDASTGRMPFPPAVAFDHLGPLILGHHALDLEEELVFRAAAHLAV